MIHNRTPHHPSLLYFNSFQPLNYQYHANIPTNVPTANAEYASEDDDESQLQIPCLGSSNSQFFLHKNRPRLFIPSSSAFKRPITEALLNIGNIAASITSEEAPEILNSSIPGACPNAERESLKRENEELKSMN